MPRPEQKKTNKRAEAHDGKHGGEIVEGRHKGGAFAKGNSIATTHGDRVSAGMRLRNALRDQLGEDKVRQLTDELFNISMSSEQDPKDRLKAIDLLLGYAMGKPTGGAALEVTNDTEGNQTVRFLVVGENGDEREV